MSFYIRNEPVGIQSWQPVKYCSACHEKWEVCQCEEEENAVCPKCKKPAKECSGAYRFSYCTGCGVPVRDCEATHHNGEAYCRGCEEAPKE